MSRRPPAWTRLGDETLLDLRFCDLRLTLADSRLEASVERLYGELARIRLAHPALRSAQMYPAEWAEWQTQFSPVGVGVDVARQAAIYHRWATLPDGEVENIVVVLNFADAEQWLTIAQAFAGPAGGGRAPKGADQ